MHRNTIPETMLPVEVRVGMGCAPDRLAARGTLFTNAHCAAPAYTPDVEGRYPAPFYDPFTSLSWLATWSEIITRWYPRVSANRPMLTVTFAEPAE